MTIKDDNDEKRKVQQDDEVVKTLRENYLFKQLSKEIVAFCQNNINSTQDCQSFILYELNLRCVDKNVLSKLAEQRDIGVQ